MIRILFFMIVMMQFSCARNFTIKPQGEGVYKVWASDLGECHGFSGVETCSEGLKPLIQSRASRELCNGNIGPLYGCGKDSLNGFVAFACMVECIKEPEKVITNSNEDEPAKPPTKAILEKAKKCQGKGGVWVNDSCQVEIE